MFGFFWSWWVVGVRVGGTGCGGGWIGEGGLRAARKDDEGLGEVMRWEGVRVLDELDCRRK